MWDFDDDGNLVFIDELGNSYTPGELGLSLDPTAGDLQVIDSGDDAGLIGYSWGDVKDYKDLSQEDLTKRLEDAFKAAGTKLSAADQKSWIDKIVKAAQTPAGLATLGTGIYALMGGNEPKVGGYQGTVPQKTLVREQTAQPTYQPYTGQATMGRRFFTDAQYVAPAEAEAARTAAKEQAAAYKAPIAPPATQSPLATAKQEEKYNPIQAAQTLISTEQGKTMYSGGIAGLAKGRYLRGSTDGMADEIPSSIDGKQPAALSHGEFVVPADVVSHLGNGNSDAGADQLYKMMDRIRKARTGNKEQGKRINPDSFMPGGMAKYSSGGIASFTTGGTTDTALSRTAAASPFGATQSATLAPWAAGYVTDYLSKGQALASEPYQAYQGPLTAGVSPLQQQAYQTAGQIDPNAKFGMADLEQYMNPYTQLALQPQLDELRRQAQISQQNLQGQFTKAGAFGGGREAIAQTENLRNLGQLQAGVIGKGYENAFNQAMNQYNVGRGQRLADLSAVAGLGAQQRGIEQEGITALQKQFEQERQFPYTQLQFQQGLLQGLPVGTTSVTPNLSDLAKAGITGEQMRKIYDLLKGIPGFGDN